MIDIKRNTDPEAGPLDGVTAGLSSVITKFDRPKQRGNSRKGIKRQTAIKSQAKRPCEIFCAYSNNVVSFSMRGMDMMLTVRIDELFEVLKAAADANHQLNPTPPKEYTDEELEQKWAELEDVALDEAESPSGLILSKAWWLFPKGTDRDDVWRYFDSRHSKGVAHLLGEA